MLVRRLNERLLAEARRKGFEEGFKQGMKAEHQRWMAWYNKLPQEFRGQIPTAATAGTTSILFKITEFCFGNIRRSRAGGNLEPGE